VELGTRDELSCAEFAPRRGKLTEISHTGTHSEDQNSRFYLALRGLRSGSNTFCSTAFLSSARELLDLWGFAFEICSYRERLVLTLRAFVHTCRSPASVLPDCGDFCGDTLSHPMVFGA
jgi:hypothetical protein